MPDLIMNQEVQSPAGGKGALRRAMAWGSSFLATEGVDNPGLESHVLLAEALGVGRAELLAMGDGAYTENIRRQFDFFLRQRASHVPTAYILGRKEFWSREFSVDRRVLIPRPETEGLVEAALEHLRPGQRVFDIGTGCGNIIITVAHELGRGDWLASDISGDALGVARLNAERLATGMDISWHRCDVFEGLNGMENTFDAVLSNPPYIPSGDIPGLQREVSRYEPDLALNGGPDGLSLIRRIVSGAGRFLLHGGWLIMEIGCHQAGAVGRIISDSNLFHSLRFHKDLAGIDRTVIARRS